MPSIPLAGRRPLALLVALLILPACAGTGAPHGWGAAPRPQRTPADGQRPPVAERPPARPSPQFEAGPERRPATASGLVVPVVGIAGGDLRDTFTSPRSGGRTHNAIDIVAPRGTPVVAVTAGTVTRRSWNALGGRTLYLTSADGQFDYYYAHLDAYADDVEQGTRVGRGQTLGTVGSTGNAQGPHLHFQVLDKRGGGRGVPVNPYVLLRTAELAQAD